MNIPQPVTLMYAEKCAEVIELKQRNTDLEAENARLATRVNELIAMTAMNH